MCYPSAVNQKTLSIIIKAQDQASKVMDGVGNRATAMAAKVKDAAMAATKIAGAALAAGLGLATKASWDQVSSVQQATLALRAYERDGSKVNAVLSDLLKYARSDMGVLFNRTDLFKSAQNLKLYGDNTANLTDHVKILSRSVGLGLSTWDGLNNVIGRVGSTGRLYADDLQYLQNAGFDLDSSLSGSTQTFESLFAILDKGIPADALAGQANTIQGLGIRMQTAFRGIGDAILGVDSESNQFIKGGLGDRMVKSMAATTGALKAAKPVIANAMTTIFELFEKAGAALGKAWNSDQIKSIRDELGSAFKELATVVQTQLLPAMEKLKPLWKALGEAAVIGAIALVLGVILEVVNAVKTAISIWSSLANAAVSAFNWIVSAAQNIWTTIVTVFNSIKNAVILAFQTIWTTAIQPVVNFVTSAFNTIGAVASYIWQWIAALAALAWSQIWSYISPVYNQIVAGANWIGGVLSSAWSWISSAAGTAWNAIKGAVSSAWNWISSVWSSAAGWFGGIWNSISNAASGAGGRIRSAIVGAFESAKSAASSAVNWIIDRLNSVIGAINSVASKVPGAPKLGTIPGFASGVRNFSGGLAVVGEQGPELVSLPRGSNVHSNEESARMGGVTNNFYGTIQLTTAEAVDRFADRYEMGAYGVSV